MNLINQIQNEEELLSVRDHIRNVMADKMSLPMGLGKANERVAWMLGARDWNTAVGMVKNRSAATESTETQEPSAPSEAEIVRDNVTNRVLALSGDPSLKGAAPDWFTREFVGGIQHLVHECGITPDLQKRRADEPWVMTSLRGFVGALIQSGKASTDALDAYLKSHTGLSFAHMAHAGGCCHRCESLLDPQGYCTDETCPHSDYGQHVHDFSVREETGKPRKRIRATLKSDDGLCDVDFDAAPYFIHQLVEGRIGKTIENLNAIEWAGDYAADQVALFFDGKPEYVRTSPEYREVSEAFRHIEGIPDTRANKDIRGFEVYVEKEDCKTWLSEVLPLLAVLFSD